MGAEVPMRRSPGRSPRRASYSHTRSNFPACGFPRVDVLGVGLRLSLCRVGSFAADPGSSTFARAHDTGKREAFFGS